jgi:hypothetical protein
MEPMADDKKEPWLNLLALTTVILAVCATLATFKGGGYSTARVLSQSQASDQWAYYQAKGIKGNFYELQKERLKLEIKALETRGPKDVLEDYRQALAESEKKVAKYEDEKAKIMKEARAFEEVRDNAQKHGQGFGLAVIFLQIAILLSSIAALMKQKYAWFVGLGAGCFGLLYFFNGFFLFMK